MTVFHAALARLAGADGGAFASNVRIEEAGGIVTNLMPHSELRPSDIALGAVVPGFVNAHSHAFHRNLRGHTHVDGGDFWRWRERMYIEAAALTPDGYRDLATRVFTEMRDAGYTSVSEFHYVHHQPDGTPYPAHDMEIALADAAAAAGIRLLLLDTLYLRGGIGLLLSPQQRRFGDADVHAWLARWRSLRGALAGYGTVTLGAALHSIRAVEPADLSAVAVGLPADVPLHVHVSEQAAENEQCLAAYGKTPTQILAAHGLVTERLSAVHGTHLTQDDIRLLGDAGATIVMCPTTEADLGDGIGSAPELLAAGARLAIGSDENVTVDPWEEVARLELDQRLRLHRRGIFTPAQLWRAGSGSDGLAVGTPLDAVELGLGSPRLAGAPAEQYPLVARSGDVTATIVGGTLTRPGRGWQC